MCCVCVCTLSTGCRFAFVLDYSLSLHIVHTTKGAGKVFTSNGWTASTRTRRDWSSWLFTSTDGVHHQKQASDIASPIKPNQTHSCMQSANHLYMLGHTYIAVLASFQNTRTEMERDKHANSAQRVYVCTKQWKALSQYIWMYAEQVCKPTHWPILHGLIVGTVSPAI